MDKDKTLYKGWLTLKEREVDGRRYEILHQRDAVAALILDTKDRVLLVEQFRPALMKGTLEIPAGCLDKPGKSPKEIMVEELWEEARLAFPAEKLHQMISFYPEMGISPGVITIYFGQLDKEGADVLITEDDDVTKAFYLSLGELGDRIEEGEIKDIKTQIAYYYYMHNFKKYDKER